MKILVGFFLTLSFVFVSCEFEEPEFGDFSNVKLLKSDGNHLTLSFDMQVKNPNAFGMKIKKGTINVQANGQDLGVLKLSDKIKLKRKSDKTYTVPLSLDLADGAVFRMIKLSLAKSVDLKLDGKIRGSIMGIGKTVEVHETKTVEGGKLKLPG